MNEKEGARTANGVDKPKVGAEEGREVHLVHGFTFSSRVFSSLGKVVSDQC